MRKTHGGQPLKAGPPLGLPKATLALAKSVQAASSTQRASSAQNHVAAAPLVLSKVTTKTAQSSNIDGQGANDSTYGQAAQNVLPGAAGSSSVSASPTIVADGATGVAPKDSSQRTWVNLFKDNRKLSKGIKLHQTMEQDKVLIGEQEMDSTENAWGCSLLGFIAGRFPGRFAIQNLVSSWHVPCKHYFHDKGWIVFKFQNEEIRDKILSGGPYMIFGRPLMLRSMPICFAFDDSELLIMPLWITLPGLPLECWNATILSKIASQVGKPITTDELTETKQRVSYARVLVEVDVSKPLKKSVHLCMPHGRERIQPVCFEFEPRFCSICKSIRHGEDACMLKVKTRADEHEKAQEKPAQTEKLTAEKIPARNTGKKADTFLPDEVFFASEIAQAIPSAINKEEGESNKVSTKGNTEVLISVQPEACQRLEENAANQASRVGHECGVSVQSEILCDEMARDEVRDIDMAVRNPGAEVVCGDASVSEPDDPISPSEVLVEMAEEDKDDEPRHVVSDSPSLTESPIIKFKVFKSAKKNHKDKGKKGGKGRGKKRGTPQ